MWSALHVRDAKSLVHSVYAAYEISLGTTNELRIIGKYFEL